MKLSSSVRRLSGLVLLLSLIGCDSGLKTYPTEGIVQFPDGTIAKGGMIEFRSEEAATKGVSARAVIGSDGRYSLKTRAKGKEIDGAVVGKHSVILIPPPDPKGSVEGQSSAKPLFHMDMSSHDRSGLTAEVQAGKNDIPITAKKP